MSHRAGVNIFQDTSDTFASTDLDYGMKSVLDCRRPSPIGPNAKLHVDHSWKGTHLGNIAYERFVSVWDCLGVVWSVLGASREPLGAFWERMRAFGSAFAFGSVLGAFGICFFWCVCVGWGGGTFWERLEATGNVWERLEVFWKRLNAF